MKSILRERVLGMRDSLSFSDIEIKSTEIIEKLIGLEEFVRAKTVCVYVSFKSEVRTHYLIRGFLGKKKIVVPKVVGSKLVLGSIDSFEELAEGAYGILEPKSVREVKVEDVDMFVIPGAVFDLKGYRVGYGKGYYDKLLAGSKAVKVGLAFDCQIVDSIPAEEHDVKVDMVVTESGVKSFK